MRTLKPVLSPLAQVTESGLYPTSDSLDTVNNYVLQIASSRERVESDLRMLTTLASSEGIDVVQDDDVVEIDHRVGPSLHTVYGPYHEPDDTVQIRKKGHPRTALLSKIEELKKKIADLTNVSDDAVIHSVVDRLAKQDVDTAFNNAQVMYTTEFFASVDRDFALKLSSALYRYFLSVGKANPNWLQTEAQSNIG